MVYSSKQMLDNQYVLKEAYFIKNLEIILFFNYD